MFFLHPAVLFGLLGLSVPIAIHLIAKQKRERVVFSSLRFLRASQQRVGRTMNVQQLILLLLRLAILALLVLAFSRPMSVGGWFASFFGADSRQVLFLMDTSYSMGTMIGNESSLDRSKRAALSILDSLRAGSKVALGTFNRTANLQSAGWTADRFEIRKRLEQLPLSSATTNVASALSIIPSLLQTAGPGTREIFLFTDLQDAGWEHVERWETHDEKTRLTVVDCSRPIGQNACIDSLNLNVIPTLRNAPIRVNATVKNYGNEEFSPQCSFYVQDRKAGERRLYLPPLGTAEVQFEFTPSERGYVSGYLALSDDALETDNHHYFCAWLPDTISVMIMDRKGDVNPPSHYYLTNALSPPIKQISIVQPKIVNVLTQNDLLGADMVIVTDAKNLTSMPFIEKWVNDGGKLVIFAGDGNHAESAFDFLIPGVMLSAQSSTVKITKAAELDDLILSLIRENEFYQTAPVLVDSANPDIHIHAWFNDGRPAVIQRSLGKGGVIYLAIPCDARWTDFPLHVSFLPFIHETLSGFHKKKFDLGIGEPLKPQQNEFEILPAMTIRKPDTREIRYEPDPDTTPPKTEQAGIYEFAYKKNGIVQREFLAANVETAESDPQKIDPYELKNYLPEAFVIPAERILSAPRQTVGIGEWTDIFLLLTLILVVVEFLVAGRFAVPRIRVQQRGNQAGWNS